MVMMAIPEPASKVGFVKAQKGSEVLAPEGWWQGGDLDHCWLLSLVGWRCGEGVSAARLSNLTDNKEEEKGHVAAC